MFWLKDRYGTKLGHSSPISEKNTNPYTFFQIYRDQPSSVMPTQTRTKWDLGAQNQIHRFHQNSRITRLKQQFSPSTVCLLGLMVFLYLRNFFILILNISISFSGSGECRGAWGDLSPLPKKKNIYPQQPFKTYNHFKYFIFINLG